MWSGHRVILEKNIKTKPKDVVKFVAQLKNVAVQGWHEEQTKNGFRDINKGMTICRALDCRMIYKKS